MYYHSMSIGFIEIPKVNSSLNIYTVGCPFKCKGCQNKDLQDFYHKDRKILKSDDILKYIKNSNSFIDGICWLGGEPLFQFKDFISINHTIKAFYPRIIITLFTGYILSEIKETHEEEYEELINANINYIIDGPWKGFPISHEKTNQKIYKLDYDDQDYKQITYNEYISKIK